MMNNVITIMYRYCTFQRVSFLVFLFWREQFSRHQS